MDAFSEIPSDTWEDIPQAAPSKAGSSTKAAKSKLGSLRQMQALARAGDFEKIFDQLQSNQARLLDPRAAQRYLLAALESACRKNPQTFSDRVFQRILVFATHIALRLQLSTARYLEDNGERLMDPDRAGEELTNKVLKPVTEVALVISDLMRSMAATRRLWTLARKGESPRRPGRKLLPSWPYTDEACDRGIGPWESN